MSKQFDVVVIGGGPGGYIAAIRAAQLGFNVACIDEWKNAKGGPAPGGTCTNVGCIPSKALLQSSEHFEQAGHTFADHGINVPGPGARPGARCWRARTASSKQNNDGILYLFKKNKIAFFHGRGSFAKAGRRRLRDQGRRRDAEETLVGKHVDRGDRLERARAAGRAVRREEHPVERRRAAHRRGAEEAGR